MTDWIMELLSMAEDGESEEAEREDGFEIGEEPRLPAPPREDGGPQEQALRRMAAMEAAEPGEAARQAAEQAAEAAQVRTGDAPPQGAQTAEGGGTAEDGWRWARYERLGQLALSALRAWAGGPAEMAPDGDAGTAGPGAGADGTEEAAAGLEKLYRQTAEAVRPSAPAPAPASERTGRSVRSAEIEGVAYSAVDELDRAVRRDSRRYDGGMTIF